MAATGPHTSPTSGQRHARVAPPSHRPGVISAHTSNAERYVDHVPRVGFLHTSPVHVATFDGLVAGAGQPAETTHSVRADLLASVIKTGITPSISAEIQLELHALRDAGADVIVCTCSSIGDVAEALSAEVRVIRVDRPMAALVAATATNVAVVMALVSTLEPTLDLLAEEIALLGRNVTVEAAPVLEAWPYFEAGDNDAYLKAIVEHVVAIDSSFDTIVLAQASMAGAIDLLPDNANRTVVASPAIAVAAALQAINGEATA